MRDVPVHISATSVPVQDAAHCPSLRAGRALGNPACTRDCLLDILAPFTPDSFSAQYFDLKALRIAASPASSPAINSSTAVPHPANSTTASGRSQAETRFAGLGASATELVEKYIPMFAAQGKLAKNIDTRFHGAKMPAFTSTDGPAEVMKVIKEGKTIVVRYEFIDLPAGDPISCLADTFSQQFGLPTSVHAYVGGPGDQALDPHTDPYDTFILHLFGRKKWKVRCALCCLLFLLLIIAVCVFCRYAFLSPRAPRHGLAH